MIPNMFSECCVVWTCPLLHLCELGPVAQVAVGTSRPVHVPALHTTIKNKVNVQIKKGKTKIVATLLGLLI